MNKQSKRTCLTSFELLSGNETQRLVWDFLSKKMEKKDSWAQDSVTEEMTASRMVRKLGILVFDSDLDDCFKYRCSECVDAICGVRLRDMFLTTRFMYAGNTLISQTEPKLKDVSRISLGRI